MSNDFIRAHPLLVFVIGPVLILALVVVVSGIAEIVLDHFILGRAENGLPMLFTIPWMRRLIAGWNLTLVYLLPIPIVVAVWKVGKDHRVANAWLIVGSVSICVVGGLHSIQAVWTGVKGSSTLRIGPVGSTEIGAIRIVINLAICALTSLALTRRLPRKGVLDVRQ